MIFWLLFLFYIFILIFRLLSSAPKPHFKIRLVDSRDQVRHAECTKDIDCKSSEICFDNKCTLKLRGDNCNPLTGNWVPVQINDKTFVKCVCKYPDLVNQNVEGGDCVVTEACRPHGVFNYGNRDPKLYGRCICDPGYREDVKFQCNKELPFRQNKFRCQSDELTRAEASQVFEREYLDAVPRRINCFKRPCGFNVLNGRPLKRTKFDPDGCHCNPRFGNFGVRLDGKYLKTKGYNACANVFEREPHYPIDVTLYNYFYIRDLDPVSFIHFDVQNDKEVVPQLRSRVRNYSIQISEDWKNSYAQYVLGEKHFRVHTRNCSYLDRVLYIETCNELVLKMNRMADCDTIIRRLDPNDNSHINAYKLLYEFPVCFFGPSNSKNNRHARYVNKFVLNPFLLTLEKQPVLMRSNGFKLEFLHWQHNWNLKLAETEFDKYKSTSQAPDLDNGTLAICNLK